MKRAEYLLLLLPLLFLAFCGGYFLGTSQGDGGLTVTASPVPATQTRASVAISTGETIPAETEASSETVPAETAPPGPLDINTATVEELIALPGIGEVLAQNIVDFRQANGPFASIDELNAVPGIGERRLEQLRDYITVEETDENSGS